ncbi:hypothetical protein PAAL109150_24925 [Paenibacillus alkaliterrae]
MKKALVLGCAGSGKSTFSTLLGQVTGLPVIHLYKLNQNTSCHREVFIASPSKL